MLQLELSQPKSCFAQVLEPQSVGANASSLHQHERSCADRKPPISSTLAVEIWNPNNLDSQGVLKFFFSRTLLPPPPGPIIQTTLYTWFNPNKTNLLTTISDEITNPARREQTPNMNPACKPSSTERRVPEEDQKLIKKGHRGSLPWPRREPTPFCQRVRGFPEMQTNLGSRLDLRYLAQTMENLFLCLLLLSKPQTALALLFFTGFSSET